MPQAISIQNLQKTYRSGGNKSRKALLNLDLTIEQGDIFGFIGPNGAGKTTTIKILVGLLAPSSGSAFLFNELAGTITAKRNLGYLSEVPYYYEFMEAGKLLDFYASLYGMERTARRKRIDEVLGDVNLLDKKHTRLKEFSKGMQQRFGIAQALISNPPLLMLDEPTSGLDPIAQKEIKDIILSLKNRGITIFFSSHQLTQVENICDRIGIIHKGEILRNGSLKELLKDISGDFYSLSFSSQPDELPLRLKEKGMTPESINDRTYNVMLPRSDIGEVIDLLRSGKGELLELTPHTETLENLFFRLIREADHGIS
jgi:ABC-2 type transport system ATP-binding protein